MKKNINPNAENKSKGTGIFTPFKKFLAPETNIVKYGKWYSIAPMIIIAVGLLVVLIWNFNLGLDFTGGRIIKVSGINDANYVECKTVVSDILKEELGSGSANKAFFQREISTKGGVALTVRYPEPKGTEQEIDDINAEIKTLIETRMTEHGYSVIVDSANSISANASSERMLNVFIAVFASLISILIYMLFRFKVTSGIASIIALSHDVLIMLSLVAIFRIEINFVFVAAVITVVAYSLNNTLVIFDRVRDKEKVPSSGLSVEQMMNSSIKETFFRTMITSITTLIPITILCILGITSIREFALPIIFGLVAGSYSTLLIASSLYVRFENAKLAKAKIKRQIKNN